MKFLKRVTDPAQIENPKMVVFHLGYARDLIQGLPVDGLNELGRYEVTWVILQGNAFVLQNAVPKRPFVEAQPHFSFESFFAVFKWLKEQKFGLCLHMNSPWWIKLASFCALIPFRGGHLKHPWDAIFLNSTYFAEQETKHQTDFYHRLTSEAFQIIHDDRGLPNLSLQPKDSGIFMRLQVLPQQYYVVHCSALPGLTAWPAENYAELVKGLTKDFPVILISTRDDRKSAKKLKQMVSHLPKVYWAGHDLQSDQLIDLISQARVFIGPDSDEIHLAASCGIPVVGLYSRYAKDQPEQWRPRGRMTLSIQPAVHFTGPDSISKLVVRDVLEKVYKFS